MNLKQWVDGLPFKTRTCLIVLWALGMSIFFAHLVNNKLNSDTSLNEKVISLTSKNLSLQTRIEQDSLSIVGYSGLADELKMQLKSAQVDLKLVTKKLIALDERHNKTLAQIDNASPDEAVGDFLDENGYEDLPVTLYQDSNAIIPIDAIRQANRTTEDARYLQSKTIEQGLIITNMDVQISILTKTVYVKDKQIEDCKDMFNASSEQNKNLEQIIAEQKKQYQKQRAKTLFGAAAAGALIIVAIIL